MKSSYYLFLAALIISQMASALNQANCSTDQLVDAPEFDSVSVRDLKSSTKYIKISTGEERCATILQPVNDEYASESSSGLFDGVFDISNRTFSMKTYGQKFCIENGSIWEIVYAGQTMKTAYLELRQINQPESQRLIFTTYYESSLRSAKSSNGLFALKCVR